MSHEWHRGILNASSWHGLEEVGVMPTAEAMIAAGERTGAWPTKVELREMTTLAAPNTLRVPGKCVVARYGDGHLSALATVGDRYQPLSPAEWRDLVKAAVKAGGKPSGAFSLRGGTRVLATFEVGDRNGIATNLCLADSFDGSTKTLGGMTATRVVCANTLAAALKESSDWVKLRHTASLSDKVPLLAKAIDGAIVEGAKIKAKYASAEQYRISGPEVESILNRLFPLPAKDEVGAGATRARRAYADALDALSIPENQAGPTLASVWNASTWLVDRTVDGKARKPRGDSDALDTLLFGTRGKRLIEISDVMDSVLKDGVQTAPVDAMELLASLQA